MLQAAVAQNISPAITNTSTGVNEQSSCNWKLNSRINYAKQHSVIYFHCHAHKKLNDIETS